MLLRYLLLLIAFTMPQRILHASHAKALQYSDAVVREVVTERAEEIMEQVFPYSVQQKYHAFEESYVSPWSIRCWHFRQGMFYYGLVFFPDYAINARQRALLRAAKNSDVETVKVLLGQKVNPNIADAHGITPLMWSVLRDNSEIFTLLLQARVAVGAHDRNGFTALMQAVSLPATISRQVMITVLTQLTVVKIKQALTLAKSHGNVRAVEIIKTFLYERFSEAINANNSGGVAWALATGADVDARESGSVFCGFNGETPLIRAALYSGTSQPTSVWKFAVFKEERANRGLGYSNPSFRRSIEAHRAIMKKLIEAGADINAQNSVGVTPLIAATMMGNLEDVKLLLDAGADITLKTHEPFPNNESALFFAKDPAVYAIIVAYVARPIVRETLEKLTNTDVSRPIEPLIHGYMLPHENEIKEAREQYQLKIAQEEEKEHEDRHLKKQQSCCIIS